MPTMVEKQAKAKHEEKSLILKHLKYFHFVLSTLADPSMTHQTTEENIKEALCWAKLAENAANAVLDRNDSLEESTVNKFLSDLPSIRCRSLADNQIVPQEIKLNLHLLASPQGTPDIASFGDSQESKEVSSNSLEFHKMRAGARLLLIRIVFTSIFTYHASSDTKSTANLPEPFQSIPKTVEFILDLVCNLHRQSVDELNLKCDSRSFVIAASNYVVYPIVQMGIKLSRDALMKQFSAPDSRELGFDVVTLESMSLLLLTRLIQMWKQQSDSDDTFRRLARIARVSPRLIAASILIAEGMQGCLDKCSSADIRMQFPDGGDAYERVLRSTLLSETQSILPQGALTPSFVFTYKWGDSKSKLVWFDSLSTPCECQALIKTLSSISSFLKGLVTINM